MSKAKRLLKYAINPWYGALDETKNHYMAKYIAQSQEKAAVDNAIVESAIGRENFLKQQQDAVDKKNKLIAEQESQRAEGGGAPVKKTYLGSGGSSGGYIDEEAIKTKKRLGGSK